MKNQVSLRRKMQSQFNHGNRDNEKRKPYRTAMKAAKDIIEDAFKSMINLIDLQGFYILIQFR